MTAQSEGVDKRSHQGEGYGRLAFDGLLLLIPQNQIRSAEPITDLHAGTDGIGYVIVSGKRHPVYSLDRYFAPLTEVPETRRVCVLLSGAKRAFGLTCDALGTIAATEVKRCPLPECMRTPQTAITDLAIVGADVACVSDADGIARAIRAGNAGAHEGAPERSNTEEAS